METRLADFIKDTPQGREADSILRACVHCGFCNATCPTYQLLGDELDGPRGRIYLIKQMLEGAAPTEKTRLHLDRCLTCRACETTCPSGVRYGRLADIGRDMLEKLVKRSFVESVRRTVLRTTLTHPALFNPLLRLGRLLRPLLPEKPRRKIPKAERQAPWPSTGHARKMLVLEGCVQAAIAPGINSAAARVLSRLGVSLVPARGCCGALPYHMNAQQEGKDYMRRNIDSWWRDIEQGAEALVITASGCGAMVKEYGHLLKDDPVYSEKARRVSEMAKDIVEIINAEKDKISAQIARQEKRQARSAVHSPCSLQHALKLGGTVEKLLADCGFELTSVADAHLCCGSAGTYSILQPELSQRLLANKIKALRSGAPNQILTANIGCLAHLQSATELPVKHWIQALDETLNRVYPE
ncbi:MAG TPA: glycolate oxidase subunit GlcF [Burkholderiales bacterium]|nr:glycolate oxidase subunit GlcF [Burkholderiales bacterium]